MRTICPAPMRGLVIAALVTLAVVASPSVASAQLGVGARVAWVTPDTDVEVDRVRFIGGQVRFLSSGLGLEVAMDHHSGEFPLVNQKVTETPIQASVILLLGNRKARPYLLGGPGWYRRKVELLDGAGETALVTTEFGWHAGVGLEVFASRHVGIHGDYRYTFLDFSGDDNTDAGFIGRVLPIGRLLPGHRGSMWTLGASFYF